jgi:DNA-binding response OmpR family regulator
MKNYYIAIERDIKRFEFYKTLWEAHDIEGIKADTMTDGIREVIRIEKSKVSEVYFVSIVADEVDFMPQLNILREGTEAPILVAVSKTNYSEVEHHEALKNGADFYAPYCETPERDIVGVLSVINSISHRYKSRKSHCKILAYGDILIDEQHHKAFFKDKEVLLTGTEMKIMHYMMINRGIILKHEQIYRNAYDDFDDRTPDSLYSAMKRLRRKIYEAVNTDYIETVRGVGYRLKANVNLNTH